MTPSTSSKGSFISIDAAHFAAASPSVLYCSKAAPLGGGVEVERVSYRVCAYACDEIPPDGGIMPHLGAVLYGLMTAD